MNTHTFTSTPIHLKSVSIDIKADASGVTLGAQADGSMLIDLHFDTAEQVDSTIVGLVLARHFFVSAQGVQA